MTITSILIFGVLALCARALPPAFDARESSVEGTHNALLTGITTCREIVSSFLARIEEFDPTLNSIIRLNPSALSVADQRDTELSNGNATGKLFCIPILLKDNFDAVGMPTTAGCLQLADARPSRDAPTVKALKDEGAVILGKVNLHELALEGLSVSSLGGQTVNPYDHTRTPGGSSGGTGAAIASSFSIIGTGTDTMNSLRSPASANNLFSFRPTRGLISRSGIVPVSYTQDAAGAMARSPEDLAVALTVMASVGRDTTDNATALIPKEVIAKDYSSALHGDSLRGRKFGLVEGFLNRSSSDETSPVNRAMSHMVSVLKAAGAEVILIKDAIFDTNQLSADMDMQVHEYSEGLTSYLQNPYLKGKHPKQFSQLYKGKEFLVIPNQYRFIRCALTNSTGDSSYSIKKQAIRDLSRYLHDKMSKLSLDGLIYPEQKNLVVKIGSPSQSGRNGILAALTGSPVVVVPAGWSPPTADAPIGVPIGMEILGLPWTEEKLLNIAYHLSRVAPMRRMPAFASTSIEAKTYTHVPNIRPARHGISSNYPLGKF